MVVREKHRQGLTIPAILAIRERAFRRLSGLNRYCAYVMRGVPFLPNPDWFYG